MSELGHILVVDDDVEVCTMVDEYLTDQGYRITVSHDGGGMRQVLGRAK
ncbi:MAG: hypothetical protein ACREFB_15420 [Stellaceae bacterium]